MKIPIAYNSKAAGYISKYPKEFTFGTQKELYCKLCLKSVNSNKKDFVDSHRSTKKHSTGLKILESVKSSEHPLKECAGMLENKFLDMFIRGFPAADIPLSRVNVPELQELFLFMRFKMPAETTARAYLLNHFSTTNFNNLVEVFKDEKIFLVADESDISGTRYFNILAGLVRSTHRTYILTVTPIPENVSLDNILVRSYVKTAMDKFNIKANNILLFLSDAAFYMVKAISVLKNDYLRMFHVTCLAHLVHNCAMRIKGNFENVDRLISCVKAVTIKNRTNAQLFEHIGKPPSVIVTRWSSWLSASMYYCKNLPIVRKIVLEIEGDGILINKARNAVLNTEIDRELLTIKECYECLIVVLDKFENSTLNIGNSLEVLRNLDLKADPLRLKDYLKQRLDKNEISKIDTMENKDISPEEYAFLRACPATSIAAERSFSMLKKMLADDRNFKDDNIYSYFANYYNSKN